MKTRLYALMMVAVAIVSVTGHAAQPTTLSGDDRQQILDLISTYSLTYDGKDLEGFVALFTSACVWETYAHGASTPMIKAANRDELRSLATQRMAMLQQKGIQSRHYQTNTVLSLREDGQVEGTTMLNLVWQVAAEKPISVMTGIYRDVFVRADGRWKFAARTFYMDQSEITK